MATTAREQLDIYKTHQRKGISDREIEARALMSCASDMAAARASENDRALYDNAIRRNQKLWTLFQVALCDPTNPLPHELKVVLLNLSCYVDKVSFRALADYKPSLLASLIDINRHVAAGLSKDPKAGDQAPPPPMPEAPPGPVMTTA